MIDTAFWENKKVLITGHTGFKGAWLSLWLSRLGAKVFGCALPPIDGSSLYSVANVAALIERDEKIDIRNLEALQQFFQQVQPEIVFHLAAQSLVRESYRDPVVTYDTNVLGTQHLLESVRYTESVKACVVVTTDKCYENDDSGVPFSEDMPLGGYDPYSSSKACAEILTASYRRSYFNADKGGSRELGLATARAGNVIGGGDTAMDRLVPDVIQNLIAGEDISLRYPESVRPWQYVLDVLAGYLLLSQKLYSEPLSYSEAWNFGPSVVGERSVLNIVDGLCKHWNSHSQWRLSSADKPHEAEILRLDSTKSLVRLEWKSGCFDMNEVLKQIIHWHKAFINKEDMRHESNLQLDIYEAAMRRVEL